MLDLISIGECLIELSSDKPLADSEIFKKSYAKVLIETQFGSPSMLVCVSPCLPPTFA